MEFSTVEAAHRLGVSQRQVERLVAAGRLVTTRTVGRSVLVDAASVVALAGQDRVKGRPWSPTAAWGALWRLSGIDAEWLDGQTAYRLAKRLRKVGVDGLLWACRNRATGRTYRCSNSFLEDLRSVVRTTGSSGLVRSRDLMAQPADRVDGYCTTAERDYLIKSCFLVAEPGGNLVLRVADEAAVESWQGTMPVAVVAADLAESTDARERDIGRNLLAGLLYGDTVPA